MIDHINYSAFGKILSETNPSVGDRFKFTGREWDAATGLYYFRARFYDPSTGRFLSQDPSSFNGGDTNLYRYVLNNPLNLTDPSGLLVKLPPGGGGGGGGGGPQGPSPFRFVDRTALCVVLGLQAAVSTLEVADRNELSDLLTFLLVEGSGVATFAGCFYFIVYVPLSAEEAAED